MKTPLYLLAALAGCTPLARAQGAFTIDWSAIGGGGGLAAGNGEFAIAGSTIGQFAAGDPAGGTAGEFSLTGGYWTFAIAPTADPDLTIHLDGSTVTLTWNGSGPRVVLEHSADLRLWAPVIPQPAGPPLSEPLGSVRFYRIRPTPD